MGTRRNNEYYRIDYEHLQERDMDEKIKELTDITQRHEVDIEILKQSTKFHEDQMNKIITFQDTQREVLGHMKTTLSNVAWVIGISVVVVPFIIQALMKTFKG